MVVLLVALGLGVIGAITAGPSIANGVGETFQRALCRVTGDGCRSLVRQACTVRTAGTDISASVTFTFVRLGRTTALLRSERSDGTVDLTLLDKLDGGLVAGVGASGRLQVGGRSIGAGAVAQAAAVAQLGGGRVWRVADTGAADRLQRKLIEVLVGRGGSSLPVIGPALAVAQSVLDVGSGTDLPRPTSRIVAGRVGVAATLDGPLGADVELAAGLALGGSQDVAGGGGSVFLAVDGSAGAALLAGAAGLGLGGDVRLALALDRGGRPLSLSLAGTGRIGITGHRSSDRGGDGLRFARGSGREARGQLTATLDLTVPGHAAAAARLLRALAPGGSGDLVAAGRLLGRAFAAGARVDVARYANRERRYGGTVEAGLGPRAGAGLEITRAGGELRDAWTRPPGGAWERRADCLARA